MALVSKELRCRAPFRTERTGAIAEEAVVVEGKSREALEVRVRFEPNRIERECLANAYEQVVPNRRRVVVFVEAGSPVVCAPLLQRVGGVEE